MATMPNVAATDWWSVADSIGRPNSRGDVCRLFASLDNRDVNVIVGATYEVPRTQRQQRRDAFRRKGLQDSVHHKTACPVLGRDIVARRLPILGVTTRKERVSGKYNSRRVLGRAGQAAVLTLAPVG
jgi:hypothetical protein